MKKILIAIVAVSLGFVGVSQTLAGAESANAKFDLPNGTHVKVDICHNVSHNPHIVPVSINAADFPYSTAHGDMVLTDQAGFVSFAPHIGTGGHDQDYVVRVYLKKGNVETNTYVSETGCGDTPPPPPPVLVSASVCFEGDVTEFGPAVAAVVDAQVAAFLAANVGAVLFEEGDTCVVEEPTTTTTTGPPVTPETPVVPETPVAPVPVAPTGPVTAPKPPVKLPHTV